MGEPSESNDAGSLDFDKAQFDQPALGGLACSSCKLPPGESYFSLNGHTVCPRCLEQLRAGQKSSFFKALALGMLAGTVGAVVYYGIRELMKGRDFALITVVLGIMVGVAVRRGAGSSQSLIYRLMAVALAWAAMCVTYIPTIAESLAKDNAEAGGAGLYIVSALFSLAVPYYLVANAEVIGILIFGFGLWEAWRLSGPRPFAVEGPFVTAGAAAPTPPAEPAAAPVP